MSLGTHHCESHLGGRREDNRPVSVTLVPLKARSVHPCALFISSVFVVVILAVAVAKMRMCFEEQGRNGNGPPLDSHSLGGDDLY